MRDLSLSGSPSDLVRFATMTYNSHREESTMDNDAISKFTLRQRFTQAIHGLRPPGASLCVHFCCPAEMELRLPRRTRNDRTGSFVEKRETRAKAQRRKERERLLLMPWRLGVLAREMPQRPDSLDDISNLELRISNCKMKIKNTNHCESSFEPRST